MRNVDRLSKIYISTYEKYKRMLELYLNGFKHDLIPFLTIAKFACIVSLRY